MKRATVSTLIIMSLAYDLATCGLCASPENREVPVVETLNSLDGTMLQLAMKLKLGQSNFTEPGRESLTFLKGIKGVHVVISPEIEECGLRKEAVKTTIELCLRRNNIEIYDAPQDPNAMKVFMLSHPGSLFNMAGLALTIDSISHSKRDVIAASVELSQNQLANLLSADTPTFILARTWHQGQQVIGSQGSIAQGCREAIQELVDEYCNDWLAAHTKREVDKLPQNRRLPKVKVEADGAKTHVESKTGPRSRAEPTQP